MKIQYCSDLHLEFSANRKFLTDHPLQPVGNILILAGDILPLSLIGASNWFFDLLSANFETTYWLPGNHEYYKFNLANKKGTFCEKIRSNIFLVNNYTTFHGDVRFIFSTLWSKIGRAKEFQIERGMNDFYEIKIDGNYFTAKDFNNLHQEGKQYIIDELALKNSGRTVVVTHHVPTFFNYPTQYKTSILNEAFASEMHDVIENSNADYWIYGHHHVNVPEFTIGRTRLVTNQMGYVSHNEHKLFDRGAVLAL